jgi:hypothetical protein
VTNRRHKVLDVRHFIKAIPMPRMLRRVAGSLPLATMSSGPDLITGNQLLRSISPIFVYSILGCTEATCNRARRRTILAPIRNQFCNRLIL